MLKHSQQQPDSYNSLDASSQDLDKLLKSIAGGDRNALAELYKLTSKNVYSYALSILKDIHTSQDVLQDCYLNVYSAAASYSGRGKPMAWILTITRNLCLKCIRSSAKLTQLSEEEWNLVPQGEFESSANDRIMLSVCMKSLTDEERQIVVLHAVSGLKHREISNLLQMPLSTVLSKYNRTIKKIKKLLEEGASL